MTVSSVLLANWLPITSVPLAFVLLGRLRRLGEPSIPATQADAGAASSAAIVIPARNEAASIGLLLTDLAAVEGAPEVIVVNDHSTDDTAIRARAFPNVTVIDAPPLPRGWRGKTWACHVGAERAIDTLAGRDGATLIFLDADVRIAPGAVQAMLAERRRRGGVVSVQPYHDAPTAIEQLSAPFNVVSMMGVAAGSDQPRALFGPTICCTVEDYLLVDGHRSVRASIAEDVALAEQFRDAGVRRSVSAGGGLVRFRMYPTGLAALREGWTKNVATGAVTIPWWRALGVAWWITGMIAAALSLVRVAFGTPPEAGSAVAAVLVYAATARTFGVVARRLGSFRWWTWACYPIVFVGFVALFVESLWKTFVRRSVSWRGRVVDLRSGVDTEVTA